MDRCVCPTQELPLESVLGAAFSAGNSQQAAGDWKEELITHLWPQAAVFSYS